MTSDSATTATVLTPAGRGAVAVIAVAGPRGTELVETFLKLQSAPKFSERPLGRIAYGRWGNEPAEDVVACRRAPQQVEIHCHGGSAAAQRILDDLKSAGAVLKSWPDWLNQQEPAPLRAAARAALAKATTQRAAAILLDQYHGALETALQNIIALLDAFSAQAAVELKTLLARAPLGLHLTQPWRVVIAGPPNVGKSSLLNALLGYSRAIVFDQPGTTRDVVSAATALDGWPVQLSDTAGWRISDDPLEAAGVERAGQQASSADCLLLVFDITQPWTEAQQQLVDAWQKSIVVFNKCDLAPAEPPKILRDTHCTSAVTGEGIDTLIQKIVAHLVPWKTNPGDPIPFTQSQIAQLQAAVHSLQHGNSAETRSLLLSLLAKS